MRPSSGGMSKRHDDDPSPMDVVTAAAWFGLVGGLIEITLVSLERRSYPLLRLSDDFVWMAPAVLVIVALAVSVPCALSAWRLNGRIGLRLSVLAAASLAALDLLMLVPRLSHYAAVLLAFGAGVHGSRLVVKHWPGFRRMMRRSTAPLLVCIALVAAGVWLSSPRPTSRGGDQMAGGEAPRSPNVILITLDTVRAPNLELYGYSRQTMPGLERFAQRGVVFEHAFATAPWTLPSHASLFTGRWPHELSADYETPLDATYPTVAEYLAARGYATAGFAANLGYCSYESGLGRGFQHYEDYPRSIGQIASSSTLVRNVANNFRVRRILRTDQHLNRVTAADLNARVIGWLSSRPLQAPPFFVFVNYFDAHEPYLPPPPYDTRFGPARQRGRYSPLHRWLWDVSVGHRPMRPEEIREEVDAYDSALAYLDDQVTALLDDLSRRRLLDDTIVIVTSDHGEEFGEHGVFDHGYSLYRQALHVPLVVVDTRRGPQGMRIATPVSLRDIPATIVETLGRNENSPFPGESLARWWRNQPAADRTVDRGLLTELKRVEGQPEWFPASKGDMKGAFYGRFHYVLGGDGAEELYQFEGDAGEHNNLARLPAFQSRLAEGRAVVRQLATPP
jgi:arylsulfatase A-like enzyme